MGNIDFYSILKKNKELFSMPGMKIEERNTDRFVEYNRDKIRVDRIAYENYGDATLGVLIMLANPDYFLEFDIPNNTIIRVPYPLEEVEGDVIRKLNRGTEVSILL